ncbi:hypothetical protein [Rudaea cellulosilytica]|uniref:hypothetical protein n=1 Tax=Rudaea cellulosilytica TaxID=540746 RepID=UPI000360F1CE|nr:hypothetical protein [Rudaea cellulosilytica]
MVTVVPTTPLVGLMLVIVGAAQAGMHIRSIATPIQRSHAATRSLALPRFIADIAIIRLSICGSLFSIILDRQKRPSMTTLRASLARAVLNLEFEERGS